MECAICHGNVIFTSRTMLTTDMQCTSCGAHNPPIVEEEKEETEEESELTR